MAQDNSRAPRRDSQGNLLFYSYGIRQEGNKYYLEFQPHRNSKREDYVKIEATPFSTHSNGKPLYVATAPDNIDFHDLKVKKGDLIMCTSTGYIHPIKLAAIQDYNKGDVEFAFIENKGVTLGRYIKGNHNKDWYVIANGSTEYDPNGKRVLTNGKWGDYSNATSSNNSSQTDSTPSTSSTSTNGSSSTSSTSSTKGSSSTSSTSSTITTGSTTGTGSTTSTDSTSNRSFDFLDNVLGTQKKEDSKDKTTELDPNQVANTIVSDTKLNDTAISSLVSTYLNSLYRINRSYNTQTK